MPVDRTESLGVPAPARPYQGLPAGAVTRFAAAFVDLLVAALVTIGLYVGALGVRFIFRPRNFHWPHNAGSTVPTIGVFVAIIYLCVAWSTSGRTFGGTLFGLRVVNSHQRRLRAPYAALRAVFYVVFPIGLLWVVVSRENRSLQDLVLRTWAIYDWTARLEP
jgi:uncharacterized RDD family membrane protein YckC